MVTSIANPLNAITHSVSTDNNWSFNRFADQTHGNRRSNKMRYGTAYLLILVLSAAATAWAGSACQGMLRPFGAPTNEVVEIVSEWFSDQGYAVRRELPSPGYVNLTAWKSQEEWNINVRPQSALACVVTVIHKNVVHANQACRSLREYVDGYLLGTPPKRPPQTRARDLTVPVAVLDRVETVVCIQARSSGREVQFSGVVVDPEGLVLCTGHDLTGQQQVTVTFYDGSSSPGIVTRLDLPRDLALVECSAGERAFVSLSTGRNLLDMAETVYAIGCPNNLRGMLAPGTIAGSPRLVNDQPLWQVTMDIFPGSSGSPVFDAQGRVVAMVKGRYRGTASVGFLTPLETIIAFLLDQDD